jgi:hypothetical protein
MHMKKIAGLAFAGLALNVALLSNAKAAVDTSCEVRSNRSSVSVNGSRLGPGLYRASIQSPNSKAGRVFSRNLLRPVKGEVEFDFDSNPKDVAKGATRIAPNYIKNNRVVGNLWKLNANRLLSFAGAWSEVCARK